MGPNATPIEWIRGRSLAPWLVGFMAVFLGAFVGIYLVLRAALPSVGGVVLTPSFQFVLEMIALAASVPFAILWVLLVLYPATQLGVSGARVLVDYGLRSELFPWGRVVLDGDRLISTTRRLRAPVIPGLTAHQAVRVAYLDPRARSQRAAALAVAGVTFMKGALGQGPTAMSAQTMRRTVVTEPPGLGA